MIEPIITTILKKISVVITLLVFISSTIVALPVQAAFNPEINYQGKLFDPSTGGPVADADYDIVFKLYTVASGGSAIWTESRTGASDVAVADGLFSVMLGSITTLGGVDFNQPLWLGVTVESDSEMSPRKPLGAVPAAFVADTLDGIDSTSFLRSDIDDEVDAGTTLTVTGILDTNGDVSFADADIAFDAAATNFTTTGDFSINGGKLSISKATGVTTISDGLVLGTNVSLGGDVITDYTGAGLSLVTGALSIANTGVTAASYGGSSTVPVIAVNSRGQITSASSSPIQISASAINAGTLGVSRGGSGRGSFTSYGLIAGGTTSTGVQQSITNGSSGTFLKSNGTTSLPSWTTLSPTDIPNLDASKITSGVFDVARIANLTVADLASANVSQFTNDAGYVADLATFDTDDLLEGSTNLYSQWDAATGGINYAGGNVGIGTTTPGAKLEVNAGGIEAGLRVGHSGLGRYITLGYDNASSVYSSGATATAFIGTSGAPDKIIVQSNLGVNGGIRIGSSNSNYAEILNSAGNLVLGGTTGNVGIGTASPTYKLDVSDDARFTGKLTLGDVTSTSGTELLSAQYSNGTLANLFTVRSSGALAMGYGVVGSPTVGLGYVSSTGVAAARSSIETGGGFVKVNVANSSTTTIGDPITMTQIGNFTSSGLALAVGNFLNFGTVGSGGYGLRDIAGVMYYKDSGGSWTAINTLAGGSLNIGGAVGSGDANSVLYVDASGNLAQDADNFDYIAGTGLYLADGIEVVGTATLTDIFTDSIASTFGGQFNNINVGASAGYVNFNSTVGSTGYGFRDSGGTLQYKNSGGSWNPITSGATQLNGLSDVSISSVATGNLLRYNGSNFVNTNLVAGDIPNLDTAKITTGVFDVARIANLTVADLASANISQFTNNSGYLTSVDIADINATGTADSSTYLRGDGTWSTIGGSSVFTQSGSDAYYTGGNIGIGVTDPTQSLTLGGNLEFRNDAIIYLKDNSATALSINAVGSATSIFSISTVDGAEEVSFGASGGDVLVGESGSPSNLVFDAAGSYINFNGTSGTSGYGFRDNAGVVEYKSSGGAWNPFSAGGASQLSDLSDVNTSTPTNRNVLIADGVDFESRALVEADISDFGTYLTGNQSITLSGDATGSGTTSITVSLATNSVSDNEINYSAVTLTDFTNDAGFITSADDSVSGTELDGVFSTTGILRRTGAGTYSTLTDNSTNWNTAYGWGNHASAGYITNLSSFDTDDLSEGSTNLYSQWSNETGGIAYGSGKVGINTTTMNESLNVSGNIDLLIDSTIYINDGSATAFAITGNGTTDNYLVINTSGSGDEVTIGLPGGDVYIGSTGNAANIVFEEGGEYINWAGTSGTTGYGIRDNAGTIQYKNSGGAWTSISSGGGGISIGDSIGSATAGSMFFAGAGGILAQDNANLFWDDTNNRLGIGTAVPDTSLHVKGTGNQSLTVESSHTTGTSISIENTTTGSNTYEFYTTGSANYIGAGHFGIYDATNAKVQNVISENGNFAIRRDSQFLFGDDADYVYSSSGLISDIGIGRAAAGVLKVTNGSTGGGSILLGASGYANFGAISGSTGYGIRDNAGTIQYKNSGGAWTAFGGGGSSTFLGLTDTPSSFSAYAIPVVNDSGTAIVQDAGLYYGGGYLYTQTVTVAGDHYFLSNSGGNNSSGILSFNSANTNISDEYINWGGSSVGSTGYGLRNNAGTIEYKNSGGTWNPFSSGGGMAIGGAVTSGTNRSVLFVDSSGNLAQDANGLSFDSANNYLGINWPTSFGAPTKSLSIYGGNGIAWYQATGAPTSAMFQVDSVSNNGRLRVNSDFNTSVFTMDASTGKLQVGDASTVSGRIEVVNDTASAIVNLTAGYLNFSGTVGSTGYGIRDNAGTIEYKNSGGTWNPFSSGGGMAIGGAITSGTSGSALFVNSSGQLSQDNANYFWDNTNKRLGIGTATPNAALHVDGNIEIGEGSTSYKLLSYNAARTNSGSLELYNLATGNTTLGTDFASGHVILSPGSSGGVGIGTASPGYKLEVAGSTKVTSLGINVNPAVNADLTIRSGGSGRDTVKILNSLGNSLVEITESGSQIGYIDIYDASTTQTRISSSGNSYFNGSSLGIGTTSPNHLLDVDGNIGLTAGQYINWGATDGTGGYGLWDDSGTLKYKNSGGSWAAFGGGGGSSPWTTSGSNIYYNTGKVTIGLSTPILDSDFGVYNASNAVVGIAGGADATLKISSAAADDSVIALGSGATITKYGTSGLLPGAVQTFNLGGYIGFSAYNGTYSAGTEVQIDHTGVSFLNGLGGNMYLNFDMDEFGSSSAGYGFRDNAGTMEFKDDGGSWASLAGLSDGRLKNIQSRIGSASALDQIRQLRPTTYTWKNADDYGSQTELGFIAQEVQQIIPEVVRQSGENLSIRYEQISVLNTGAIQELDIKIDKASVEAAAIRKIAEEAKTAADRATNRGVMVSQVSSGVQSVLDAIGVVIENGRAVFARLFLREVVVVTDNDEETPDAIGTIVFEEGETELVVENSFVKETSKVMLTPRALLAGWFLKEVKDGEFTVEIARISGDDSEITFDYWIIGVESEDESASTTQTSEGSPHVDYSSGTPQLIPIDRDEEEGVNPDPSDDDSDPVVEDQSDDPVEIIAPEPEPEPEVVVPVETPATPDVADPDNQELLD